jgi:hypothetical protein
MVGPGAGRLHFDGGPGPLSGALTVKMTKKFAVPIQFAASAQPLRCEYGVKNWNRRERNRDFVRLTL